MNREVKVLFKELAKKYDLTLEQLEEIFEAPFRLQVENMKKRCDRRKLTFPSLRIPYFGIFYCPEWHKQRLKKKNETIRSDK